MRPVRIRVADVHAAAAHRPAGYVGEVFSAGRVEGEFLVLSADAMSRLKARYSPGVWPMTALDSPRIPRPSPSADRGRPWALKLAVGIGRRLGCTGLGDLVHRLAGWLGLVRLTAWLEARTGWRCGCASRRARWNRRWPF